MQNDKYGIATLQCAPDIVYKILFSYLGPIDSFKLVATWSGTINNFFFFNLPHNRKQLVNSEIFYVSFKKEWCKGTQSAVDKWNRMIGPITHIRLEKCLTTNIQHPSKMTFLFSSLSLCLNSIIVNIEEAYDTNTTYPLSILNPSNESLSISSPLLCLQHVFSDIPYTLHLTEISFNATISSGIWGTPLIGMHRLVNWMNFLLSITHVEELQTLSLKLDISYLKCQSLVHNWFDILQRFTKLRNVQLSIQANPMNKLSRGFCNILKGPTAVSLHQQFFSTFLVPLVSSTQLEKLVILLVLPEAVTALQDMFLNYKTKLKCIKHVIIHIQHVSYSQKEKFQAQQLYNAMKIAIHEFQQSMISIVCIKRFNITHNFFFYGPVPALLSRNGMTKKLTAITPSTSSWIVWKFGGTSLSDTTRILHVATLICRAFENLSATSTHKNDMNKTTLNHHNDLIVPPVLSLNIHTIDSHRLAVVVSAMAGITDALQVACTQAAELFYSKEDTMSKYSVYSHSTNCTDTLIKNTPAMTTIDTIQHRQETAIDILVRQGELDYMEGEKQKYLLHTDLQQIIDILQAISHLGTCPIPLQELVMGHGELWSSRLLYGILSKRLGFPNVQSQTTTFEKLEHSTTHGLAVPNKKLNSILSYTDQMKDKWKRIEKCNFCGLSSWEHTVKSGISVVHCSLQPVIWLDSRKILKINDIDGTGVIQDRVFLNVESSKQSMSDWLNSHTDCKIVIITGYICSTDSGIPSTLRRNGSDYSGSLFAALLNAISYTVWTDVDGIYTADPRKVPTAQRLRFLSYTEAIELAYFGAKVLHPLTMEPCIKNNIPILLRSTFHPEIRGTLISQTYPSSIIVDNIILKQQSSYPYHYESHDSFHNSLKHHLPFETIKQPMVEETLIDNKKNSHLLSDCCKAFTLINDVSLIYLKGSSMVGVPSIASRLFSAVYKANCTIIMISQACSQHSVCFAIPTNCTDRVQSAIELAFYKEIIHDETVTVSVENKCSIICAVGEKLCGTIGVIGHLSSALALANINVKAMSQGSSEYNITFVIDAIYAVKGLQAMHDSIYFPTYQQQSLQCSQYTTKQSFRIVFLVCQLPLFGTAHSYMTQLMQFMSTELSDQHLRNWPLVHSPELEGITDGCIFLKTDWIYNQHKTINYVSLSTPANDLLDQHYNHETIFGTFPIVLIDLRKQLLFHYDPHISVIQMNGSSVLHQDIDHRCHIENPSITINDDVPEEKQHESLYNKQAFKKHQQQFIYRWKQTGRLFVDDQGIQTCSAINTLIHTLHEFHPQLFDDQEIKE